MTIDIEALLRRVVAQVFDSDVDVAYSGARVRLTDPTGARHAQLQASDEYFEATILDVGFSTSLFDYDDDEKYKEAILCELAHVVRAYLRGEGRLEHRRALLRSHPLMRIEVDNREWELGRKTHRPHYPD